MTDPKPSFFIVGAPKCGTTALAEYLRTHPEIGVSRPKEPHFFGSDVIQHRKVDAWDDYLVLFNDDVGKARLWGEASTHYLRSERALPEITSAYPTAKFLVMIREPWHSAFSWHHHLCALGQQPILDFRCAWLRGRQQTASLSPGDIRVDTAYLDIVSYGAQLRRLQQFVDPERLLIIDFEEFCTNTECVFIRVLQFLDVEPNTRTRNFLPINQRKISRLQSLQKLVTYPPRPLFAAWKVLRRNTAFRVFARSVLLKGRDEIAPVDRGLVERDVAEDWALAAAIRDEHNQTNS